EVAPTKVWPQPLEATDAEIDAYRRFWADRGFEVVAAQALLFGRPELTLFDSAETARKTLDYLRGVVRLCARLGAGALVFGSPKNRRVGNGSPHKARLAAVEFFTKLGEIAQAAVTRAAEAVELVRAVNHPGFRLHLDTGCMTLASDPVGATFDAGFPLVRHFH